MEDRRGKKEAKRYCCWMFLGSVNCRGERSQCDMSGSWREGHKISPALDTYAAIASKGGNTISKFTEESLNNRGIVS